MKLLLVLILGPASAWAQACCTGTGAGEFGIVGRCQQGVLATSLSYSHSVASFDTDGERRALSDADVDDVIWSMGAGWRLTRLWQVHGSVPLRFQRRAFGGLDADAEVGFGDANLGTRYTVLEDSMAGLNESWRPFFDVYALVQLPTGRAPEASEVSSGADVTGAGNFTFSAGMRLTKFVTLSDVLTLSGSLGLRPERTIDLGSHTRRFKAGSVVDAHLMYLRIWNILWSGGVHLTGRWAGNSTEDGREMPNSGSTRYRMGVHITHALKLPTWEVTVAGWLDPWWTHGATNQPFVGPTVSLTLQRSFL